MTNMTTKLIATAVVALATGVASAQAMNADIPFAFRAGDKMMEPGTYAVHSTGYASPTVIVRNQETHQSALLLPNSKEPASKELQAKGEAVLLFECGAGRCSLKGMWDGMDDPYLSFPSRGPGKYESGTAAMIRVVRLSVQH